MGRESDFIDLDFFRGHILKRKNRGFCVGGALIRLESILRAERDF
jgi:hypothetical protein